MDNQEVSAFAAYSVKKKSGKLDFNQKLKLKNKKKKMKLLNSTVNSVVDTLVKATDSSLLQNSNDKSKKKQVGKKHLIKSILNAKKESIFKHCTVSTKTDNMFLKENDTIEEIINKPSKENKSDLSEHKKLKKKKLMNGEQITNYESIRNIPQSTKSTIVMDDTKKVKIEYNLNIMDNPAEVDNELLKQKKKNKFKKVVDKQTFPNFIYSDSVKVGEEVLSWLLNPLSLKEFFNNSWEQKPLHIQHNDKNYFKCICTLEDFKSALRENDMYFTRNIDVTSYIDGERNTHNPEGKAKPPLVWDFFRNGKSIRLLNPQTFIPSIRVLNTALQEFFHCFVGANIYLTPPGTQGFAPHYDDIEAFVLQLEGEKHWKLYNPRSPEEVLPRESSRNFREDEIGEPVLEITLQPGDMLYFPRGIIHQAKCLPDVHSLHITVSCYQKNSWADLLEKVLPVALQKAINEDVELRKGLPLGYLNSLGMIYSDRKSVQRQEIVKKFKELAQKVLGHCPLDAGIDQLGVKYIHDALPPFLNEMEMLHGADRNCRVEDKNVFIALKNSGKNLKVKLIRATSVRLVSEEEEIVLYYTTDNSLVYHEFEVSSITVSTQWALAVEYLLHSYPHFVEMKDLPVSNTVNTPGKWKRIVDFVYFLWQKGLLLFDRPLLQICS